MTRFAIIMVGIPGVGKSFVSKKLQKYLSFYGVDTKVFNVGAYRRHMIGQVSSDFFDPSNKDQFQKRYDISTVALDDLISYVNGKGQVGILDTTITTIAKCRDEFAAKCEANDIRVVFIEIICEDAAAIERNIREVKSLSQDYIGFDSIDNVVNDFQMRIKNHLPFYEPLQDNEQRPYVKVMTDGQQNNFGDHILLHKINGYLETKIIYFLMNIQTKPKKIYLILPPDDRNLKEDVATESDSYAIKVGNKMHDIASESRDVIVYCAPRAYALDTCSRLPDHFQVIERTELSEMHPGEHSHLTMKDIEAQFPEQYAKYCKDPFKHRFPRAESYKDVSIRLERMLVDMERIDKDVVICADRNVLKVIYGYLDGCKSGEIPMIDIRNDEIVCAVPHAYGISDVRVSLE